MGIADLKEHHKHIRGIDGLSMQYGDGGKTEIYVMGDVRVELPNGATTDQIGAALLNAVPSSLARVDQAVSDLKKNLNQDQAA